MFVDEEWKKEQQKTGRLNRDGSLIGLSNIKYLTIILLVIIGFIIILFIILNKENSARLNLKPSENKTATSTGNSSKLPHIFDNKNGNGGNADLLASDIKAEDLMFGHFYNKLEDEFAPAIKGYTLPISIKMDVNNYYDLSRKIDLSGVVDDLNNNGFSILNNQFESEADDFFDIYRLLSQKDIPVLVTTDFIFYFYQNILKKSFKEIEKNAFYDNLWEINKKLFNISLTRYKKRLEEAGEANDPMLEGARLELAFFTTALQILKPRDNQINDNIKFTDESKFSEHDGWNYSFNMPDYLKHQIESEVELIYKAGGVAASPVLLYDRNYREFLVPKEYKNNAKLHNFYLALKWYNSLFPLYYQNELCEECKLDRDDWLINMIAASYISKDLSDNQDIKNQWAIIYKFISFFNGLRSDLTYLDYNRILNDNFGPEYKVENIFNSDINERDNNIINLQNSISNITFLPIEGGRSEGGGSRREVGMRLLQQNYWPNQYILESLTGEDFVYRGDFVKGGETETGCRTRFSNNVIRCRGFGMDIIHLVQEVNNGGEFFNKNTNYSSYDERITSLREEVQEFDVYSWNNNIFWTSLDTARTLLATEREGMPTYIKTNKWENTKLYNTFLGAWVNLHLGDDEWVNYQEKVGSYLGGSAKCNTNSFIEPNLSFINEMMAKNSMLIDMLLTLNVTKNTNLVTIDLRELNKTFEKIKAIIKKELAGVTISDDDCRFIGDFTRQFVIERKSNKNLEIKFVNSKLKESINGVKMLIVVNGDENRKNLVIGPVFNYQEN